MFDVSLKESKKDVNTPKLSLQVGYIASGSIDALIKAAENEFGIERIPERSFIRSTIDENEKHITTIIAKQYVEVMVGAITSSEFITTIGQFIKGLIQNKIASASSWATPLAASTVAKKGHSRPLIDTGEMYAEVRYEQV